MGGDLHCHTRLSDGSVGIEDIIALARNCKLDTIAITDHDCLAGTVRAKIIGERNGVRVIPGVELSAVDPVTGRYAHILCYLPDHPDRLEGLCRKNTEARKRTTQFMMGKTAGRYPVTAELMRKCGAGSTCLYKQHIMHALMECGISESIYSDIYYELFSPESEKNILIKTSYAPVEEVIAAVHTAGGIAVLAHPKLYDSFSLLERLVDKLDGVEVWHPTADEETVDRLIRFAKKNKLLMTGGSDFHGMYSRKAVMLGSFITPKAQLTELLGYKAKKKRLAKKAAQADENAPSDETAQTNENASADESAQTEKSDRKEAAAAAE